MKSAGRGLHFGAQLFLPKGASFSFEELPNIFGPCIRVCTLHKSSYRVTGVREPISYESIHLFLTREAVG